MAWKPKTIAGKILKGLTIGAAVVGGVAAIAATGGTATPLVTTGAGFFGKVIGVTAKAATQVGKAVGAVAGGAYKGISAVAKAGANLVTGITAEQRRMIKEEKQETKEDVQKLTTIQKLINAGATVTEAAAKVGVSTDELKGSFGIPSEAETVKAELTGIPKQEGCATTACMLLIAGISAAFAIVKFLILS